MVPLLTCEHGQDAVFRARLPAIVVRLLFLLMIAPLGVGCSKDPAAAKPTPAAAAPSEPAAKPDESEPDSPETRPPEPPAPPVLPPVPPEADEAAKRLGAKFRAGKRCDVDALAELRELRVQYGTQSYVGKALALAFRGCDEKQAYAELFAEMLGDSGSEQDQLKLGASWLRAANYERATAVLVPLAEASGAESQAAWLAGFALFHAGDLEAAFPWLQGARGQTDTAKRADAPMLIGLCKLHVGDTDGAIEELERGVEKMPDHPGLLSALSRAYAAAGRTDDSRRLAKQSEVAANTLDGQARDQLRLSALSTAFRNARSEKRHDDADALIDAMLPLAPAPLKRQLLEQRIAIYTELGRPKKDIARVRKQLARLPKDTP